MILDAGTPTARSGIRNRLLAMIKLGAKCRNCPWGVCDPRALQFDHINGLSGKKRIPNCYMYREIIHDKAPENCYQLLCANCNWIKRYECNETHRNHGGLEIKLFREKTRRENTDIIRHFHWPRDIHGSPIEREDLLNLLYLIAEERNIDPATIPDHKYAEDARIRFNRPYGYIRPKRDGMYLSPTEHFMPSSRG